MAQNRRVEWFETLVVRASPAVTDADGAQRLDEVLLAVVICAALLAALTPLWRVLRLAVTLVHELGHAGVGLLTGRRFTAFVLRGDMSGQAVTSGPRRGPGRVATTWAGYPAPALVGVGLIWVAGRGWAAPTLTAALLVLVVALTRARSALTVAVTLAALAGTGALWWWRIDTVQNGLLTGIGVVLVVGAWRHLAAVIRVGGRGSDPAVLATLTKVPATVWNLSFAVVCLLATLLSAHLLFPTVW